MIEERGLELTKWDPNNEVLTGALYETKRILCPSISLQRVLDTCQRFLKPGWEHKDSYYRDNSEIDVFPFHFPTGTAEILFVFENPAELGLSGKPGFGAENALIFPEDRLPRNARYAQVKQEPLPSEANQAVNASLNDTPYQCLEIGARLNYFRTENRQALVYQTGVLFLDLILVDTRDTVSELEQTITNYQSQIQKSEEQLEALRHIAKREGKLLLS